MSGFSPFPIMFSMAFFLRKGGFILKKANGDSDKEAEPHSSVDCVADLRTEVGWFDPRLGQYSLRELMIFIATGFIPLSPLSDFSTMVMRESSRRLGKNIVQSSS